MAPHEAFPVTLSSSLVHWPRKEHEYCRLIKVLRNLKTRLECFHQDGQMCMHGLGSWMHEHRLPSLIENTNSSSGAKLGV